jgi:protease IV
MNFLKMFFSSCLGAFVAMVAFAILGIFILAGLGSEVSVDVKPNSVLSLKLNYPISELELDDPLADILPGAAEKNLGLMQLKSAITKAKADENIKGIYIQSGSVGAGIATIDELRAALIDFRKSGKWVVIFSDYFTEGGYYLATAADSIFLNPQGMVELNGLASEVMFFKKLFDKLEIRPQVFRVGQFKSAVEPFLRDDLSDENRLQLTELLNSIYGNMLANIAEARKLQPDRVKEIANKMSVRNAEQAKELGVVDDLYYEDQVLDFLKNKAGIDEADKLNLVSYHDYKQSGSIDKTSKNEIAVIIADGNIVQGNTDESNNLVGSNTVVEALRKARESKRVKAVVLRINSPGGSAMASDEMWREIMLTKKEKPVIASMSDYAASGGYYLAMGCDSIVAQPTTVTGSIGVFSVLFDMSQFLGNKLGITSQEVKTGEIGELITITRGLNETEKAIWQKQTDEVYETFTSKAAEGRRMKLDDLKKIASGRVWTGEQAKANGLVDVLGTFDDAVRLAAKGANVADDYAVRFYPKPKTFMEKLLAVQTEDATEARLKESLGGENALLYLQWKKLQQWQGMQARMPVEFSIK